MRAGMMPPAGMRRPDPATYKSMISWLENELDRTAAPYTPPPGLHRLNRTEYANAIHDLLDLDIDPGKYLPSDDSTHGFDNIAGALGMSSTLVEAYVSAAGKISRLAVGEPAPPTLVVYRTPEDTSQDYHIEGLPFGTRGGMLVLARLSVRRRIHGHGDADLRRQHVADRLRVGAVREARGAARRRAAGAHRIGRAAGDSASLRPTARPRPRRGAGSARCAATGCATGAAERPGRRRGRWFRGRGATPKMMRPLQDDGGPARRRRDVPADQFRAAARPRSALHARHAADRSHARASRSSRTSGRCASKARSTPRRPRIRRAAEDFRVPARPAPPTKPRARARSSRKLVTHAYRRPAAAADVDAADGRSTRRAARTASFDDGIEMVLARVLASPKFIYRIEAEPADARRPDSRIGISDLDLASRLSFFLWSTIPDDQLLTVAARDG